MDFYCERINDNFFNEPINTISNIFFVFVSIYTYRIIKKNRLNKINYLFPFLIFMIGVGSFFFHLKPNYITLLMDAIPILLFSILFIYIFNRNELKLNQTFNILVIIIYLLLFVLISPKINFDFLNGSEFYLANYLVLSFYCIVLKYKNSKRLRILFFAFILFNISLIFRTIDNFICEKFIWGTHYFWHLINAYLLQILTYIVLQIKPNYLRKIKI